LKTDRILILDEVAEWLNASVKTVRRRIASGQLRAFKEGGRVCVLESDLVSYITRRIQATATQ